MPYYVTLTTDDTLVYYSHRIFISVYILQLHQIIQICNLFFHSMTDFPC